MSIKVQKHSYEQFTQYVFLEKDVSTLKQLREAIKKYSEDKQILVMI